MKFLKFHLFIEFFSGQDLFNPTACPHLKIWRENAFFPKNGFSPIKNLAKIMSCKMKRNLSIKDRSLQARDRSLVQNLRFLNLVNLRKIITKRKRSILKRIFSQWFFFLQGLFLVERRIDPYGSYSKLSYIHPRIDPWISKDQSLFLDSRFSPCSLV